MARKLTDKVIGGIYEYYRTDNQQRQDEEIDRS